MDDMMLAIQDEIPRLDPNLLTLELDVAGHTNLLMRCHCRERASQQSQAAE